MSGPGSPPITTTTRYDENGNVFQVQQPDGDTTVNTYDLADQLSGTLIFTPAIQSKDQATGPQYDAYGYDQAGNLVQHVDADGRTSTASYDGDSRPVQAVDVTTAPTGTTTITTTPSYDPNGNTLQQSTQTADSTNPGVVQTHTYTATYNAAAWLSASSDDGKRTTYGYDGAGRLQNEVQGDPTTITTMLDPEGRVTAIGESTNGTGPVTSTFGYNLNDQPVTLTLPGPVTQTAQYDQDSRLTQLSTTGASGLAAPVASATYGYSANGWTTAATGISGTDTITHDALGRITSESGPSVIASNPSRTYRFSYDGNGNVLTASDDFGGTFTYSYSAAQPNELLQSTDPGSQYTTNPTTYFGYDSHGNTTAITTSGALTTTFGISTGISYDAQSRPITITHKDGSYSTITSTVFDTISLQYNAQGQRSRYTVALSGTVLLDQHFQYRDGELGQVSAYTATLDKADLHTVTSSGQYTDTFVYDPAGLPLEFVRQRGGTTSRYIYVLDGRNNVVAVTDLSGTVVDSYAYDWWGQQLPGLTQQQVPQQYRYGSYWQDDAVGWYWVNIRYYEPEVMRWLQPDPSEQDGVRTYAYVGDDPIDMADPSGLVSGAPPTLTPC